MPPVKPDITKPRRPCELPNPESTSSFWHSQPASVLVGHRSTRDLPKTCDVAVIGSGMTGTSIAHHLLNNDNHKPLKVVMLEAREACWGATGRVSTTYTAISLVYLTRLQERRPLPADIVRAPA
jgi:hypothetical protein